jgi:hypothetical protein
MTQDAKLNIEGVKIMTNAVNKNTVLEYNSYKKIDSNLIEKYEDKLFQKDESGNTKLNLNAYAKLSYEHLESIKSSHPSTPQPSVDPLEDYTIQMWNPQKSKWVKFNLFEAAYLIRESHIRPHMRVYKNGKWEKFNNSHLVSNILSQIWNISPPAKTPSLISKSV